MADIQNPATWLSLAEPDPEYLAAVEAIGTVPDLGKFPSIEEARKFFDASKADANNAYGAIPGVKEEDRKIAMRDGHEITVRIYCPETKPTGGSPLGMYYHGGGWCVGGLNDGEFLCRSMASSYGMIFVNVDYRLGPEWKFPTAQLDGYDAAKWAAENASSLGADPSKGFIISGTSAGGNIATGVAHLWQDDQITPKITGCHLMVPAICNSAFFPEELKKDWVSWHQLEFAPILSHKATDLFMSNFIPDVSQRGDPLFSPLLWKTGHKDLPPTYLQIAGLDPLRDEALIYERELREKNGIKTKVDVYPGVPHGFWSVFPNLKITQKFNQDSVTGIKWLLEQN